jgi:hypothetical protein
MFDFRAAEALFQVGDLGLIASVRRGAWLGLGLVVLLIFSAGKRLVGAATSGAE